MSNHIGYDAKSRTSAYIASLEAGASKVAVTSTNSYGISFSLNGSRSRSVSSSSALSLPKSPSSGRTTRRFVLVSSRPNARLINRPLGRNTPPRSSCLSNCGVHAIALVSASAVSARSAAAGCRLDGSEATSETSTSSNDSGFGALADFDFLPRAGPMLTIFSLAGALNNRGAASRRSSIDHPLGTASASACRRQSALARDPTGIGPFSSHTKS